MPVVRSVRRRASSDGSHRHIAGVCTAYGTYFTRQQVVDGIRRGESWTTRAADVTVAIAATLYCPWDGCFLTPYISTSADGSSVASLDELPDC